MQETELTKKDRVIDDLMTQQETNYNFAGQNCFANKGRTQTHLVVNLKRKIRDLNGENVKLNEEIEALRRNIRGTR